MGLGGAAGLRSCFSRSAGSDGRHGDTVVLAHKSTAGGSGCRCAMGPIGGSSGRQRPRDRRDLPAGAVAAWGTSLLSEVWWPPGGFYPEITDGCERSENFWSCLAVLRRILGLWNRSMYSNTSALAASSVE